MRFSRLAPENTTMITHRNQQGTGTSSTKRKNNYICTHCGETGHSKQRCYELIGYPEWWDFSKKPRKTIVGKAAMATSDASSSTQEGTSIPTANLCDKE